MTNQNDTPAIKKIPTQELLQDRSECLADIENCQFALLHDVMRYGGPEHNSFSVQDRLTANKEMLEYIEEELKERGFIFIHILKERNTDVKSVTFDPSAL